MKKFLNVIWHIPFMGFLLTFGYALFGLLLCCTIILIPVGLKYLELAKFLLAPFTRALVTYDDLALVTEKKEHVGVYTTLLRIIYFPFGCVAILSVLSIIIAQFITILGIPCAFAWAKTLSTFFNPFNKVCVPIEVANDIERVKSGTILSQYTVNKENEDCQQTSNATVYSNTAHKQNSVRTYTDDKLRKIISSPEMYNVNLVKECGHELEIRNNATKFFPQVCTFSDDKIEEILNSSGTYSEEIVYCCEIEQTKRVAIKEEKQKLEAEEARKLREIAEKEKRERIVAWLKKWWWCIAMTIAALITLILTLHFTSDGHHYDKAHRHVEKAYRMAHMEARMVHLSQAITHLEKINKEYDMYPDAQYEIFHYRLYEYEDTLSAAQALLNAVNESKAPVFPYIWQTYAQTLFSGSLEPHISKDVDKGIDILLNLPDYESNLLAGEMCFKSGKAYDRAYEIFSKTMKDSESTGMEDGYIGLMYLYGLNGFKKDYEKAYNYLLSAPEEPEFTVHKGDLALYLFNDHQKAKGFYEIANSLSDGDTSIKKRLEAMEKYLQNHSSEKRYWATAKKFSCTHDNIGIKITQDYNIYVGKFANGVLTEGTHISSNGKRYVGKFDLYIGLYNGIIYDIHNNIIETPSMTEDEHSTFLKERKSQEDRIKNDPAYRASINAYIIGDKHREIDGIVFWVDKTYKHGKVISLKEMIPSQRYEGGITIVYGDFNEAKEWCRKLGQGWRLPTIEELESINKNPFIKKAASMENKEYWSSTPGYLNNDTLKESFTFHFKNSKRYSTLINWTRCARAVYEF